MTEASEPELGASPSDEEDATAEASTEAEAGIAANPREIELVPTGASSEEVSGSVEARLSERTTETTLSAESSDGAAQTEEEATVEMDNSEEALSQEKKIPV